MKKGLFKEFNPVTEVAWKQKIQMDLKGLTTTRLYLPLLQKVSTLNLFTMLIVPRILKLTITPAPMGTGIFRKKFMPGMKRQPIKKLRMP